MRARPSQIGMFVVLAAGLGAGCDWRTFDNLQNQAPVLNVGTPSGYPSSNDFGGAILALTPPADGSAAAWYLGSGVEQTALGLVTIDAAGKPTAKTVPANQPSLEALENNPITSMAEIPGTTTAFLGAPTFDSLATIDLTTATVTPFVPASQAVGLDSGLGIGVAAGNLGGTATPDFVATSNTSLHVFLDGSTTDLTPVATELTKCPITLSTSLPTDQRVNRAVVVGALTGPTPVIAVGTPVPSAAGSVAFFSVGAGAVTCAFALGPPAATPDPTFGRALAVGDFDHDGVADLLVGAPPTRVYLFRGPVAAGAAPTAVITGPTGSAGFGSSLTAMDLDGMPGDEAIVGDPKYAAGGAQLAGSAFIYSGPKLATMLSPVLADHAPGSGEAYATALAALPFCAAQPCTAPTRLPLVGAPSRIFTYFDLGLGVADPRVQ
jgi:hypothetical protein